VQQFVLADETTGMGNQVLQQGKALRPQRYLDITATQAALRNIEREFTNLISPRRHSDPSLSGQLGPAARNPTGFSIASAIFQRSFGTRKPSCSPNNAVGSQPAAIQSGASK
jgi:hypothetical protein